VKRLADFIAKKSRRAKPYAGLLAERILFEAKRHGLKPHELAAVAWIESTFDRRTRGKADEHGLFQVMQREHGIKAAWEFVRTRPMEFPIARPWAGRSWRQLRRRRIKVLQDVRAGTYFGAYHIRRHVRLCRRLGHRVGAAPACSKPFVNQCSRYHKYALDRLGHYNSGISWPRAVYLRKLRWRSRVIKKILEGK
jgi:hypothetical protein